MDGLQLSDKPLERVADVPINFLTIGFFIFLAAWLFTKCIVVSNSGKFMLWIANYFSHMSVKYWVFLNVQKVFYKHSSAILRV